jgi:diguanylate cyclase (GGDEF)-like protein
MSLLWNNLTNLRGRDAQAVEQGAHAPHEALVVAVDPSYWPRALGLRVIIAFSYFVLIPAGLLPMSTGWWLLSGGGLLVYSVAAFAYYMRRPEADWLHKTVSPYIDTVVVTLATIALARPNYPIWIGYLLIVSSLSAVQNIRYVVLFSLWAVLAYWSGVAILDLSGRADPSWQLATVVSIMLVFTAINSEVISTSNRRLQEMVLHASLTDPLTGLANRRRFREILDSHHSPDNRPLAVLMYDVDNFKQINEERGHVFADTVLVRVCDELRAILRDADVVARYGGDELVVLAHVLSVDDARAMGERSLAHIRATTDIELSLGIAVYPLTAATLDDAVRVADDALGAAKRAGKARVVVAETRHAA